MEHQFKIGDRVRVIDHRPVDCYKHPVWTGAMDEYAGKEGIVEHLSEFFIDVRFETGVLYFYKPSWLEPIPAKDGPLLKVGDRVRVVKDFADFHKGDEAVVDKVDPGDPFLAYRVNGVWVGKSRIEPICTESPSRPSVVSAAKRFLGIDCPKGPAVKLPLISKTKLLTTIKLD